MKHDSPYSGFTLIELLIAIGIFSIFLVIISGIFGRFVQVQRHSIEQGALILEVQSAMESFIKEARTAYGSTFRTEDGSQVAFHNQSRVCVSYRLHNGMFERADDPRNPNGNNVCDSLDFGDTEYSPITSKGIEVTHAYFDTNQSIYDSTSLVLGSQGVVTLVFTAKSTKSNSDIPPITVQNSVTSRQTRAYAN